MAIPKSDNAAADKVDIACLGARIAASLCTDPTAYQPARFDQRGQLFFGDLVGFFGCCAFGPFGIIVDQLLVIGINALRRDEELERSG